MRPRSTGFTLVEVMVALAVVALALPALLVALYSQIDDTAYLRDKSLAHWVAIDKMSQMRLIVAASRELEVTKSSGVTELADRQWYWWVETKATPLNNMLRVDIQVALDENAQDSPLYTLSGFMSSDLTQDANPLSPGDGAQSDGSQDTGTEGGSSGASAGSASAASGRTTGLQREVVDAVGR